MATDTDPGGRAKQRRTAFKNGHRFPDLQRKPVWRERIEVLASADIFLRHTDGHLEQVAFGERSRASDVVGQEVIGSVDERTRAPPRFVQRRLQAIRATLSDPGSAPPLTLTCPPGYRTPVFCLPVVIDESGELAAALLCTLPSGHVRQRRACFVERRIPGQVSSLVLIVEGQTPVEPPALCDIARVDALEAARHCLNDIIVRAADHGNDVER